MGTITEAVTTALSKAGCKIENLIDIHHAPKLEALRYVTFHFHASLVLIPSANY